LRRGHRGKDAAVAAPGHGWPMAAGPRSNAFVMACRALARHRMEGQSLLVPFWRLKKGLAVRAKPPAAATKKRIYTQIQPPNHPTKNAPISRPGHFRLTPLTQTNPTS
jgi:hypothetical protein